MTLFDKLMPHRGHTIECVSYGDWNDPADVCLECEDCGEVLVSAEDFDIKDESEDMRVWIYNYLKGRLGGNIVNDKKTSSTPGLSVWSGT